MKDYGYGGSGHGKARGAKSVRNVGGPGQPRAVKGARSPDARNELRGVYGEGKANQGKGGRKQVDGRMLGNGSPLSRHEM